MVGETMYSEFNARKKSCVSTTERCRPSSPLVVRPGQLCLNQIYQDLLVIAGSQNRGNRTTGYEVRRLLNGVSDV